MRKTMWMVFGVVVVAACALPVTEVKEPEPTKYTGAAGLIDVMPNGAPGFDGSYGFVLLGRVKGIACASRNDDTRYWTSTDHGIGKIADDVTAQAVAAATFVAMDETEEADTVLITRVRAEAKSRDKVCATVYGRAIKLIKSGTELAPQADGSEPLMNP